jgi:uncharacterized protein (DUF1697 family)
MRYVAFLRGINVGGHKPLKMADLRAAFQGLGFQEVRTVLASGNVVFDTAPTGGAREEEIAALGARIEAGLGQVFGYTVRLAVRRLSDLERLAASDPFKSLAVTPDTRLYATFLSHPVKNGTRISPDWRVANLRLALITPGEVLSAIRLSPGWGTTELMAFLEKEFGPGVTTRNWNTVTRIIGHRDAPAA